MSNSKKTPGDAKRHLMKAEPFLERLIFNNRVVLLGIFLIITLFLGYNAIKIKPNASFERMIPLKHPFIVNMMKHESDLENIGNFIRIAVSVKHGTIYNKDYMKTLKHVTDDVFYLPGVDRSGLKSLWTPNVRWVQVTEQGFQGGAVIPDDYNGSQKSLDQLRQNIGRSGEVGQLVADDFKSSIVYAPLYEKDPRTGKKINYAELSQKLEKLRQKYDKDPNIQIHIIGFAKLVGDLITGIKSIAMFAIITILLTAIFLYWYSRCIAGTLVPIITSIIAVFWQMGILRLLGFGLDPYSVLVPFLVFSIGISHGVQVVNAMAIEASKGFDPLTSARLAFRQLYIPGTVALLCDAIGFLTLLFIQIDVIKDLAIAAGIGVAIIIITNLVLHPLIMSYMGISKSGINHVQKHDQKVDRKWRIMSYFSHPGVAPISLLIALLGFGIGLYYSQNLKIGDLDPGAPELRQNSQYNKDNRYIVDHYSTSADIMVVMVQTPPQHCEDYKVLHAMDALQWRLQNTPGVDSSKSLANVAKIVTKAFNEGNYKWYTVSPNQSVLNASLRQTPPGVINNDCSMSPLAIYLSDHKAATLQRVVDTVQKFAKANNNKDYHFLLAAGNAGVEAATNQVISRANNLMLVFVYAVISLLCLITFRSLRATICVMVPLGLTSVLCEALMAQLGIGIKVATLPVIALGVGIGVDYGIYIYTKLERYLLEGKPLQEAYFETLRSTGRAVTFTGITLAIGVVTWIWSPIKYQADMGLLLFFMFLWNMVGAIWLLPALARFLLRPDRMVAKARARNGQ